MAFIENFDSKGITYDDTKQLVGRCFEFSTYKRSSPFPIIEGDVIGWYNLNNVLVEFEFFNCKNALGLPEDEVKKEVEKLFKQQVFSKTSQQLLDDLERELTKETLKLDEISVFDPYTIYAVSTSWGNIRIGVNSCFEVCLFEMNRFYHVKKFECAFDWKETFYKRVYQQLRLRHLFKEKEA